MKKSKINALLAAGCLSFLAPSVAQAIDYNNETLSPVTLTEDTNFDNINIGGETPKTLEFQTGTTPYNLTQNTGGSVNLNGTATIQFSDKVQQVVFNTVNVSGANNTISSARNTDTGAGYAPTANLGAVTIGGGATISDLNLNNTGTGTMSVNSLTMNGNSKVILNNASSVATNISGLSNTISGSNSGTPSTLNLGALTVGAEGVENSVLSTSDNILNTVNASSVTVVSSSPAVAPDSSWNFDIKATKVADAGDNTSAKFTFETDKLNVEGTAEKLTLGIISNIGDSIAAVVPPKYNYHFIDKIKISDNEQSLFNTTIINDNAQGLPTITKNDGTVGIYYYNTDLSATNTITIANYSNNADQTVNNIIAVGTRSVDIDALTDEFDPDVPYSFRAGEGLYNIQASSKAPDNSLTINAKDDHTRYTGSGIGQLFTVDSKEISADTPVDAAPEDSLYASRTLTLKGIKLSDAVSATVGNYTNNGNGSALIVKSFENTDDPSVTAVVNLNSYTPPERELSGAIIIYEKQDVEIYDNQATNNGGAIWASGLHTAINSNATDTLKMYNNTATNGSGGAIYNTNGSTINLMGNSEYTNNTANIHGGAIFNDSILNLGSNELDTNYATQTTFDNNKATTGDGGAIYNVGSATINGNSTFKNNSATSGKGGAIYNNSDVSITTNNATQTTFDNNKATKGGAIFNDRILITPMVVGDPSSYTYGNLNIEGTASFTRNIATEGNGGAIYNVGNATINSNSSFANNIATEGNGGAIYNNHNITLGSNASDTTAFSNNSAKNGGAIYNSYDVLMHGSSGDYSPNNVDIYGNSFFVDNTATTGDGGAIYNAGVVNIGANAIGENPATISHFENNKTNNGNGGAIASIGPNSSILDPLASVNTSVTVQGNSIFNRNIANGNGGSIYNDNSTVIIGNEDVNVAPRTNTVFQFNETLKGNGGAVASVNNNLEVNGDVSYIGNVASTTDSTSATANGGAIYADGSTVTLTGSQKFDRNMAQGLGGAIYATNGATININATRNTVFSGNVQNVTFAEGTDPNCAHDRNAETGFHKYAAAERNAIYLDQGATLNLNTANDATITFNDPIAGNAGNKIVQNGTVYYNSNNQNYKGDFTLESGTANFTNAASVPFGGNTPDAPAGTYTLYGGSHLNMVNNIIIPVYANNLDLTNTTPENPAMISVDLDFSSELADRFYLNNSTSGNILVAGINAQGSSEKDSIKYILFNDNGEGESNVNVTSAVKKVTDGKLHDYNVQGITNGLLLTKINNTDPSVYGPQVAVNARLAGQLDMYNNILHRVDEIAEYRYFNKVNRTNLYASADDHPGIDNKYTPYVFQEDGGCTWLKPNATIETISPAGQDGYKNRAYNAFVGYETPISTLRSGWELINTLFGGYQGSYQDYDNIQNYQNGGVLGYMANLYRNNFFAGGVVAIGGTGVQTKDDGDLNRSLNFGLFDIGASTRVGYNVGMGNHWLLQPMLTTSYIYITGIDRHNDAGEDVYMEGTHTIQVAPGFKLVGNYGTWQPYVLCDYTWPFLAKTVANVNDVPLEDLRLRSYIEYGVGVRKNMGERFTGYLEALMRNGGRTGVSFQGGLVFKF